MTLEIRTIEDGEVITENGFYSMSLDWHHDQPCDGPSVTSGVLRRMELASPDDVWAFHKLNPNCIEQEDKTALRLGRAMAAYIEGGEDEIEKHFYLLPSDKPRRPTPQQIQAYNDGTATETGAKSVEFWKAVDADERDIVTAAEWKLITDMGAQLAKDPAASAALGGTPEITMAWRDPKTGIWCLARPDQVSFSGMLSDYKKVSTQGRPFNYRLCDSRITQHGYGMQMAFAAEGFEVLTGERPNQVGLVFQSDKAPHHVILREIYEEDLILDQWRNRCALDRFHECLESGHWPTPGEDIGAYQRPEWQREQIIQRMQEAGTAP